MNAGQHIVEELAAIGRLFYERNWVLGTSGNFSAVLTTDQLTLAITASGVHKGELSAENFLTVDATGRPKENSKAPSAETAIHLTIIQETGARAVLHTHSVWSAFLTDVFADADGIAIEGFEMLKGLRGVTTHEHREWLPVMENSQDYGALSAGIASVLRTHSEAHGVLLRRHGLYTWGQSVDEAKRHIEILEFLLEVIGRTRFAGGLMA